MTKLSVKGSQFKQAEAEKTLDTADPEKSGHKSYKVQTQTLKCIVSSHDADQLPYLEDELKMTGGKLQEHNAPSLHNCELDQELLTHPPKCV